MRRFHSRLPLFLAGFLLLLVAACGSGEEPRGTASTPDATVTETVAPTNTPAPSATPRDADQVLRANLGAEPASLDPQRATDGPSITVLRNIYSGLVRIDEAQNVVPDAAREVPTVENGGISEDGLVYTFRLRDDLKWSDGEPVVAGHFVDGAKRLFEPGSGNFYVDFYRVIAAAGYQSQVEEALKNGVAGAELEALERAVVDHLAVTAPDDHTVVFQLERRSPVFLMLATMWPLYPVRADVIAQHGDTWTEAGSHVSNGMFRLAEWKHSEDLTLEKNEHYFGAADVALQTVHLDMIEDNAVALLAYEQGELDVVTLGPAELVQVRESSELREHFRSYGQLSTFGLNFNQAFAPFADPRVRQALTGAIDRVEYAEVVREGTVLAAYGWVPPGMPGHDAQVGQQFVNATERSRALLEEAGYPGGAGLSFELLIPGTSTQKLVAQWLEERWERELGVSVDVLALEPPTYVGLLQTGDYQVVAAGWSADYADPQNWLPLFKTGGMLNAGFSSADYDAAVTAADEELDFERRISLYEAAQRILIDDAVFAPLHHGRRNVLVQPWVQGLTPSSMEGFVPGDLFLGAVSIAGRG